MRVAAEPNRGGVTAAMRSLSSHAECSRYERLVRSRLALGLL
jgi:hypothetical protein